MKNIRVIILLTMVVPLAGFFVLGCDVSPEVVYPLKIIITGISNPPPHELLSVGVFDNTDNIMPKPDEDVADMTKNATAGGLAKVVNGSAAIELMDPIEQTNFTTQGEYYVALMFGDSMDNLEAAYIYIGNNIAGRAAIEAASELSKSDLEALIYDSPMNPIKTLEDDPCRISSNTTVDLSDFVDVTPMFNTLFGEE